MWPPEITRARRGNDGIKGLETCSEKEEFGKGKEISLSQLA